MMHSMLTPPFSTPNFLNIQVNYCAWISVASFFSDRRNGNVISEVQLFALVCLFGKVALSLSNSSPL